MKSVPRTHTNGLKLLEMYMKKGGHGYKTATNGEEAVNEYKAGKFDLVLMGKCSSRRVLHRLTSNRYFDACHGRHDGDPCHSPP